MPSLESTMGIAGTLFVALFAVWRCLVMAAEWVAERFMEEPEMARSKDDANKRGRRLYRCQECGKGTLFSRREENRAARLRCSSCGSARMEISQAGGKDQTAALDARREAQDRMDDNGTGSVLPV